MNKKILSTIIPAMLLAGCSTEENVANTTTGSSTSVVASSQAGENAIITRFINANVYADRNQDGFPSESELLGTTNAEGQFLVDNELKQYPLLLQAVAYQTKSVTKPDEVLIKSALFEASSSNAFVSSLTTILVDEARKLASRDGTTIAEQLPVVEQQVIDVLSRINDAPKNVLDVNYFNAETVGEQRLAIVAKSLNNAFFEGHRGWGIDLLSEFVDAVNTLSEEQLANSHSYIKAKVKNLGEGLGYVETVELATEYHVAPLFKSAIESYLSPFNLKQGTRIEVTEVRSLLNFIANLADTHVEVVDGRGNAIQNIAGLSIAVTREVAGEVNPVDSSKFQEDKLELAMTGMPSIPGMHQFFVKVTNKTTGEYVVVPYQLEVATKYEQIERSASFDSGIAALAAKFPSQMKSNETHIVDVTPEELKNLFNAPQGTDLQVTLTGDQPFIWTQKKNIPDLANAIAVDQNLTEQEKTAESDKWVAYIQTGDVGGVIGLEVVASYSVNEQETPVIASALEEQVTRVFVYGSENDSTEQALVGKTFLVDGGLFSPTPENYKSCSLVSFNDGIIFASQLEQSTYEQCDIGASLRKVGAYTKDYNGLIATIADKTYHFSAVSLTTSVQVDNGVGGTDTVAQPTGDVALVRIAADNLLDRHRVVLTDVDSIEVKDPYSDFNSAATAKFFASSALFPAMAKPKSPSGNYFVVGSEDIWENRDMSASAFYTLSPEPKLTVQLSESCPSLRLDSYGTYIQSPILSNGAYSNTGAKVTAFSVVNGENENSCTFSYDLNSVSPAFLTPDGYFDLVIQKQPKSNYFEWTQANREGSTSVYRSNAMNYTQTIKLRVYPTKPVVSAP
ncbi:Lipoprotein [Vibrio vulnificus]|nr:hypothetical protein [Vibrio vulnificus]PWY34522.1 hypothetical protein VV86_09480 [Vibrio vulnificus]